MPEFYGQPKNSELWLPRAAVQRRRHFLHTSDGKDVGEKLWIIRGTKTYRQVKTIWGLCIGKIKYDFDQEIHMDIPTFLKADIPNAAGEPVPTSMIKEYLYAACPLRSKEGQRIPLSSNLADTVQVNKWIKNIQVFANVEWGIYIPDPDPSWRDKE